MGSQTLAGRGAKKIEGVDTRLVRKRYVWICGADGAKPSAFGAPAWVIDDRVIEILEDYRFDYLSCTRAKKPFIHER